MKTTQISQLFQSFEGIKYIHDDKEYWSARELQFLLGYKEWRNFETVLEKAMMACREAWNSKFDHFVGINKMVSLGSDAEREIFDIHLSRYAAYLVAQNGDSRKQEIAFAQAYFAVQTRKQELIEKKILDYERLSAREKLSNSEKEFTWIIFERWIDGWWIARIRSKWDSTLFGWNSTQSMKVKFWIEENRSLADFLPTVLLKAKDLAIEVTNHNLRENHAIQSEISITHEHVRNNQWVRDFLTSSWIVPEELPPSIDIQKLKRKERFEWKNLLKKKQ